MPEPSINMTNFKPELRLVATRRHDHEQYGSDGQGGGTVDVTSCRAETWEDEMEAVTGSESELVSGLESSFESSGRHEAKNSFYKSAHWTKDGTTIITSSYNNHIRSFLIPEDLLELRRSPLILEPCCTLKLAEPTNVVASAPYFDIRYPNSDHFLVAMRDHPLHLHQALFSRENYDYEKESKSTSNYQSPLSSYPLISPTTESYLPIHSIAWPSPGTHFYTATRDLIAEFDITRPGPPVTRIPTIPSRRHIRKGNGVGMKGVVSALGAQPDDPLLAAGTWTRWVGLYDISRSGECAAAWSIAHVVANAALDSVPPTQGRHNSANAAPLRGRGGVGLVQTTWSPCGRYLLLNERQSTGLLVYDVRVTNKLLCLLAGRDARTHQRLECDVFRGLNAVGGFEVWAGSKDGTVQVWEGVGNAEGCQWPSWEFSAVDGSDMPSERERDKAPAVGSIGLHKSGSVVVTCSGGWSIADDDDDHLMRPSGLRKIEASTLNLWQIGSEREHLPGAEGDHLRDEQGDSIPETAASINDDMADEIEKAKFRCATALKSIFD